MTKKVSAMAEKRHELLTDIADHVAHVLASHNVDAELAEQAGQALADHLSEAWAGSTVCFPKDHHYKLTKRDLEIYHKFTGRNHRALAQRFDLTENAIYRIVKRAHRLEIDRKQGKLALFAE